MCVGDSVILILLITLLMTAFIALTHDEETLSVECMWRYQSRPDVLILLIT